MGWWMECTDQKMGKLGTALLSYHLATFGFAIGCFIWGNVPAAGGQEGNANHYERQGFQFHL
jgi:hypothetical protein